MPPPTSVWRDRDFVRYWTGQTVSQVGSQVTELALPLVALLQLGATAPPPRCSPPRFRC